MQKELEGRDGKWVPSIQLRKSLSISRPVYLEAIRDGRISHEIIDGKEYIDISTERDKFVRTSNNPYRYTPKAIEARNNIKQKRRDIKKEKLKAKRRYNAGLVPLQEHMDMGLIGKDGKPQNVRLPLPREDSYRDGEFNHVSTKEENDEFKSTMGRRQSEAIKQLYLAKQAKLKFLKDSGELVEAEMVRKEWEAIAISVRKSMLSIPDRVAEYYAGMTNGEEIRENLLKEITHALSNLKSEVSNG